MRRGFFSGSETEKMINSEHVLLSVYISNKPYLMNVSKIVDN